MYSTCNPTSGLKVFLVDDSPGIRQRVADMLAGLPGVSVVGEAETPAEATSGILACEPDAVLLDLQLKGGSGIEVLKSVHPQKPGIVFIVLTNHSTPAYQRQCELFGAMHFIDKSLNFESVKPLVSALRDGHCCH